MSQTPHCCWSGNGRGPGGGFARACSGRRAGFCGRAAGSVLKTLQESSERHTTCGVCFGGWKERCGWPIPQAAATPASHWCQALPATFRFHHISTCPECAAAGGGSPLPPDHAGGRPPRPRPPLRHRPHPDQHRAGLAAAPQL